VGIRRVVTGGQDLISHTTSHQHFTPLVGIAVLAALSFVTLMPRALSAVDDFDLEYTAFGRLLRTHVVHTRVNYASLQRNRHELDTVVNSLTHLTAAEFDDWSSHDKIAYLINAYNALTLQVIIDHYPIKRRWFGFFSPANSIKQIPSVWSGPRWLIAGINMTLDDIEHGTLRQNYKEPRVHFAVNCASISCPPLRREPYVGARLDRQLILAAQDFLASGHGLKINHQTLYVSSMLNWYGADFVEGYSHLVKSNGSAKDRAILGIIAKHGPPEAARIAQGGNARIRYLKYDWSLNDTALR